MYIIKNAWKNLFRNAGRNLLIGVILFGIIAASVVGIAINGTAGKMINEYKSRFGTKVVLSPDIKRFRELGGNIEGYTLTSDMLMKFAESQYVKSADFMNEAGVCAVDFKEMDSEVTGGSQSFGGNGGEEVGFPTAKLKGYSSPHLIPEFENGTRKVIDGKMFTEKGECIISEDLAVKNNLSVGDTVTVKWVQPINGQQLTLKVAGIFYDTTPSHGTYGDDIQFPYLNRRNEILSSFDTIQSSFPFSEVSVSYYIGSPNDVSAFEDEMKANGLPDTFYANADTKAYQKIVAPVENLRSMATTFLVVILILGSAILILMSFMAIRERKYEIGVLRAIGMKKGKVIAGFITEILIITAFCLAIGIFTGNMVSSGVGKYMLKRQTQIISSEQQGGMQNFGRIDAFSDVPEQTTDITNDFNVSLDSRSILPIVVISLILAGIASIAGISAVIKHEPMKILSERG